MTDNALKLHLMLNIQMLVLFDQGNYNVFEEVENNLMKNKILLLEDDVSLVDGLGVSIIL